MRAVLWCVALLAASLQFALAWQEPTAPPASSSPAAEKMRAGTEAYQRGDCNQALALFREVLSASPNDSRALNLAGHCALRTKRYDDAVTFFYRAMHLQPEETDNLAGLMEAYTLAGKTQYRDALRQHIHMLHREHGLPEDFGYVFDVFQVGDRQVRVTEFAALAGQSHSRYQFDVFTPDDKWASQLALESQDADQTNFAKEHPKEAAAGQRRFTLDTYGPSSHVLIRSYDGEPAYDQVREDVKQALAGKLKPANSK